MVKRLVAVVAIFWIISASAVISNIMQCVDIALTDDLLVQFPSRDNSTPQSAVMGFVKGMVKGDCIDFLYPLSDDLRREEFGISDLTALPQGTVEGFRDFSLAQGFSNHVIRAYSQTVSNDCACAQISMSSQCGFLCKTNDLKAVFKMSGGSWRIVKWDVEE